MAADKIKICALGALYHGDKPEYLKESLRSIRNQTLKIPIILVIDGPIPKELENILMEFDELDIRFIRNARNEGLSVALQLGLDLICDEFEYVIRFDSDDINIDLRFELLRDYLTRFDVDLVSSHMYEIDERGVHFSERIVPIGSQNIRNRLPFRNPINHPASAFKIKSVMAVGGYREMPFFEDWYLWIRMSRAGYKIENIDEFLVEFRATDEMVARRYGLSYVKHELNFFIEEAKRNL